MTLRGSVLLDLSGKVDVVSFVIDWPGGLPQNPFAVQRKVNPHCFVEWNVIFRTGLPEIDRQHKRLIDLTNRLGQISTETPKVLNRTFRTLHDYIAEHFFLEERLMEESGIDAAHLQRHKKAHTLFVAKVAELWQAQHGDAAGNLAPLHAFLKLWIQQHILQTDREMAREIHARARTPADRHRDASAARAAS